jgi:putative tryptophan/tyrosine transport system substrate-binding protein
MNRKTAQQAAGLRRRVGADAAHRSTRRALLMAIGASAFAASFPAFAQSQNKIWRIGYLDLGSRQSMMDAGRYAALMQGLRERDYVEGKNFTLDMRFSDGDVARLSTYAKEFVQKKMDLIMTFGTASARAAQQATDTIPIVIISTADPVRDGFATSMAHPGSNMTGTSTNAADTVQKLVELAGIATPKLKRFAALFHPPTSSNQMMLELVQAAAKQFSKQLVPIGVHTPEEIERGFVTMARERVDAIVIFANPFLFQQRAQIAGLALKHKLPSISANEGYAEAGGLMSYGSNRTDNFHRAGFFVDRIFKGAKPGDIPFEQPTRYYFVINRKTANVLGIKITGELLTRADQVIE